jgi:hypothetical protein
MLRHCDSLPLNRVQTRIYGVTAIIRDVTAHRIHVDKDSVQTVVFPLHGSR